MTEPPNTPEFTVSELAGSLKRTVETAYGYVRVRGEISGYRRASSGHARLRTARYPPEAGSQIPAIISEPIFRASTPRLPSRDRFISVSVENNALTGPK